MWFNIIERNGRKTKLLYIIMIMIEHYLKKAFDDRTWGTTGKFPRVILVIRLQRGTKSVGGGSKQEEKVAGEK